jgi:hypothetical protein
MTDDHIAVYDYRTDGDAAFLQPLPRFFYRGFEKLIRRNHVVVVLSTALVSQNGTTGHRYQMNFYPRANDRAGIAASIYVAVYQLGKLWDQAPPEPAYSGAPVVRTIGRTKDAIDQLLHANVE